MTERTFFSFGALLKAFRTRRRLTQQQLASGIGVHRSAIIRWELGTYLPENKTIVLELARYLRLDDQETRQLLEASLTALAPHWHVPLPRNPFFTGREEILKALHTYHGKSQVVGLTHSYALQGMGGIGKTQLALEYAYRHALDYSAVFWIEAETSETVIASLLHLAEVLQLPERQESDQQRVVAAVQRWLSTHSGWLLVWDNLEDLDLLSRLLPVTVRQGAILLTTRCQALGTLARGMDVAPMAQEEGMLFVLRRAKVLSPEATEEHMQQLAARLPDEYTAAKQLVTIMGSLPLALDQAGAYIEETGCGLAGYLRRYQQQRRSLLARRGGMARDHPHSVVTTLGLACQRVAQQSSAALELLRCCACLYPDAIPEELFLTGADHLGPVLGPVVANLSLFDEVLATLRRFSLVQRQPETHTLSLHRLVQVILQEEMSEQEQAEWQQRVVQLLNAVFPESTSATTVETWGLCERLLPHVMTCLATIPDCRQDQDLAAVLLKAANYLHERGLQEQAELLYRRALHLFEQQLGPEHPQVGITLSRLAWPYRAQGKDEQAKQLFQQALHLLERALGPEHPEVALSLRGLATVYHRLGYYEQAEPLYQRALRIVEQALGPEHPEVAYLLNALGFLYRELGHYEQAEPLYQRALRIVEQALGPEHPEVARPLNNLADLYRELGHYEQAESFCQRALRIFEQALSPEHPDVASSLDTLATLYSEMGHYEQAEPLYQRAVGLLEQALSPEHPYVAFPLSGLAMIRRERGQDEEAESLYQRVLQIREQHRGPRHRETAQTLHDLALLRQQQSKLNEALSLAERALQICTQSLGEAHPQTVATQTLYTRLVQAQAAEAKKPAAKQEREAMAGAYKEAGRTDKASLSLHKGVDVSSPECDPLQAFLDACCDLHPRAWCRSADLWQAYQHWVERSQERYLLSRGAFIAQLKAHGSHADRTKTTRIWRGIALRKPGDDGG